ncbi:hypothetical protein, partial [Pseudomonas fluorescens]|uniref:hypothetical protein n=1 Tax=Pseudomonas fluorescens TaxID=294 RepID=UPI003D024F4F
RYQLHDAIQQQLTASPHYLVRYTLHTAQGLKDTIAGFKGILNGDYDHLPEQAFYMVGGIEEAIEKAKKL